MGELIMCRIHSSAQGTLKLKDVLARAGIPVTTPAPAAVESTGVQKEVIYSVAEITAARKVLERLLESPSLKNLEGANGMDSTSAVPMEA